MVGDGRAFGNIPGIAGKVPYRRRRRIVVGEACCQAPTSSLQQVQPTSLSSCAWVGAGGGPFASCVLASRWMPALVWETGRVLDGC